MVPPSWAATSTRWARATASCSTGRSCDGCVGKSRPASRGRWRTSRSSRWRVHTDSGGPTPTSPRRRTDHDAGGLPDHVPDQAGLDPRTGAGGPPTGRDPGRWPVGSPRRLGRRAPAMTVTVRPATPADAAGILAVVADAFSDEARDADEELDIVRDTWSAGRAPLHRARRRRSRHGRRPPAGRAGTARRPRDGRRRGGAGLRGIGASGQGHRHVRW